ncbi:helix-turn-helix transcriptional regulator [Stenotrophomonas sp. YAU14A_MKIMI4_1]|uniref:helix-turn-helix domain-containing protein n=1 Tax=Stenotrophomonas sp. YAU14A_MKIMI4_1 TaxID=2072408 RepID=UPI000D53D8BA|nr:helix-turn-helix transcriptional regulator [Stenotrophomonas sp. YAU14A_MKIMI4_1]AWH30620.1 XRE family transcriptional regulator [Stenotrophomonas sp. YAU14A_MKIMI4_1]
MNESLKDWSLRMARLELGQEIRAGSFGLKDVPASVQTGALSETGTESKVVFARFVELMRRKRGLTVEQLAEACGIEVADVINIEDEDLTGIGPRTVYQLANWFEVSVSKLMQLAGLKNVEDATLAQQGLRFAARSNSMASLTKEEREALDEFVSGLGEQ